VWATNSQKQQNPAQTIKPLSRTSETAGKKTNIPIKILWEEKHFYNIKKYCNMKLII
jgi:hypothetical protein